MRFMKIVLLLFVSSNAFTQTTVIGIDSILNSYNADKYFPFIIDVLDKELHDNDIDLPCAKPFINRNTQSEGLKILLIPQFSFQNDIINDDKIDLHFDSSNPINRAIIFNKIKYFGSLLFTERDSILFCPCFRKTAAYTNLDCGKYVYRESDYMRSLKHLLKKEPFIVFKDPNFERVWFYVDKNKNIFAYTYESEEYELGVFFRKKDLSKYSLPIHSILR